MASAEDKSEARKTGATHADLRRILGEMDAETAIEILALHPTVSDLEIAALYAAGEGEALGKSGRPLVGIPAEIVEILSVEEEEEEPRTPAH